MDLVSAVDRHAATNHAKSSLSLPLLFAHAAPLSERRGAHTVTAMAKRAAECAPPLRLRPSPEALITGTWHMRACESCPPPKHTRTNARPPSCVSCNAHASFPLTRPCDPCPCGPCSPTPHYHAHQPAHARTYTRSFAHSHTHNSTEFRARTRQGLIGRRRRGTTLALRCSHRLTCPSPARPARRIPSCPARSPF